MKKGILILWVGFILLIQLCDVKGLDEEFLMIDGYVFHDDNGDGIKQDHEDSIDGVKIDLWQQDNLIATLVTDENGYYLFDQILPQTSYHINVENISGYSLSCLVDSPFYIDENENYLTKDFILDQNVSYFIGFKEKRYFVYYNLNDTHGTIIDQQGPYLESDSVQLQEVHSIHKEGYHFLGWNTKKDGSGILYQEKQTFSMPSRHITLYALWQKDEPVISLQKDVSKKVETSDQEFIVIYVLLIIVSGIIIYKSTKNR